MTTNPQHPNHESEPTVHIHFLLDRSGSMASMAADVIGGFNGFLASQRALPGRSRMTLVQFDTGDPFEVLTDGLGLDRVRGLSHRTFQPRGGTPLWDAVGDLVTRASVRAEQRRALGKAAEETVVVVYTDGEENSSTRFGGDDIRRLVGAKQEEGWTFIFLGAGLDAYAEGGRIGVAVGSTQAFAPDAAGARLAFQELDRSVREFRAAPAPARTAQKADFFGGNKAAEADRRRRYDPTS
jgi:Mg-chelatase subunit ChlD